MIQRKVAVGRNHEPIPGHQLTTLVKRRRETADRRDQTVKQTDISNRPWITEARCVGVDPTLFDVFWDNSEHSGMAAISWMERDVKNKIAAEYCAECSVQQACLDDALRDPHRSGVYAGYQIFAQGEGTGINARG